MAVSMAAAWLAPHEPDGRNVVGRALCDGRRLMAPFLLSGMAAAPVVALLLAMTMLPVARGILRPVMLGRRARARRALVGDLELHLDQLLDAAQIRGLLVVAERDRDPLGAGACGAAD